MARLGFVSYSKFAKNVFSPLDQIILNIVQIVQLVEESAFRGIVESEDRGIGGSDDRGIGGSDDLRS